MVHVALLLLMLEAANADLVSTISLKRDTLNLQLSSSWPADYPISHVRYAEYRTLSRLSPLAGSSVLVSATNNILFP
jgi:hypothetical protein